MSEMRSIVTKGYFTKFCPGTGHLSQPTPTWPERPGSSVLLKHVCNVFGPTPLLIYKQAAFPYIQVCGWQEADEVT